jgi:hypothetical protein
VRNNHADFPVQQYAVAIDAVIVNAIFFYAVVVQFIVQFVVEIIFKFIIFKFIVVKFVFNAIHAVVVRDVIGRQYALHAIAVVGQTARFGSSNRRVAGFLDRACFVISRFQLRLFSLSIHFLRDCRNRCLQFGTSRHAWQRQYTRRPGARYAWLQWNILR